jgi:hypothetical protein
MLENVTKEHIMDKATDKSTTLMRITQSIISVLTISIAWGHDEPIYSFALVFAGFLLGHVLTEVLNEVDGEE